MSLPEGNVEGKEENVDITGPDLFILENLLQGQYCHLHFN